MGRKRRRKKKKGIIVIWTVVLALAVTAAALLTVAFVLHKDGSGGQAESKEVKPEELDEPEDLLSFYFSCIEKKEYEKMYQMLGEDSRAEISKEDFIARNQKIYEGIEAADIQIKVVDTESSKSVAMVRYELKMNTAAGEISFPNQSVFEKSSQGNYKYGMNWDDSVIFPNLTSSDKVRVSVQQPQRGEIVDRNQTVLAGQGTASSVGLIPGKMSENREADLARLAELLGVTAESIENKLSAKWVKDDSFVPVKTVPKLTDLEQLAEVKSEETRQKIARDQALLEIPGVMLSDETVREYPLGQAASHLTGYIQKVTAEDLEEHPDEGYNENSFIGRSGMESLYETELKGKEGCEIAIVDSDGNKKLVLAQKPKEDGETIRLTIDAGLQASLYEQYAEDKSCSVAMNPFTGEVLALVSTPSFDSNSFIYGMSEETWAALNEDSRQPLYNRFRQKLSPGSSFKPVTAAIGLDTNTIDPEEDFGNVGLSWQKDAGWGNYYVTTLHTYEPVILENALIYSDNIYFAKAALKIGKENLQNSLDRLGFNAQLPFEINVAQSQYANEDGIESEIQLADSGYGQGQILVNPIHLAALYTGFANNGDVIKPRLRYENGVKQREQDGSQEGGAQGGLQAEIWLKQAYQTEHANRIKAAMEQVIQSPHGTGHAAYREDMALAGKTGTAEIKLSKEDQNGTELGWFGIFTTDPNAEKPVLLMTMVEDVKNRGGSGYVVNNSVEILDRYFNPSKTE